MFEYIVMVYDDELNVLVGWIVEMGGFVEKVFVDVVFVLVSYDVNFVCKIIENDQWFDVFYQEVESKLIEMIVLC